MSALTDALLALAAKSTGVALTDQLTLNLDDAAHLSGDFRAGICWVRFVSGRLRAAVRGKSRGISREKIWKDSLPNFMLVKEA